MYQEVFVFVAVNPGEASGERDIDFSLYDYIYSRLAVSVDVLRIFTIFEYLIICRVTRGHSIFA